MLYMAGLGAFGNLRLLGRGSYVTLVRIQKPCTAHYPTSSKRYHVQPQQEPQPQQLAMSYNIDWIFQRMRFPNTAWYIVSQIVITAVGLLAKFVLGVLPVKYVCNTFKIRWSMAAHDICFTNKFHSILFMFGKCIPVVRGIGVYQDAINLCIQKCALGHWVHVFPEGKVNMTKEQMRLKWGVGRIIYESPCIPIILPMWHEGMDEVLPNTEPYVLQWGKRVTLNIGEPLDLNGFIQDLKDRQVAEPEARKLITDKIQDAFYHLGEETRKLHSKRL
ncbi:tafazzin isoform X9 [Eurosta solidaginis]|uniref:tafazzin isoform X9 n=1 Tax=Eurosta solidaginis TaxID=178769 RepID=UPI0035310535